MAPEVTLPRYVTFTHASPYATWNAFQAWCRLQRRVPDHVALAHLASVSEHGDTIANGLRRIMQHLGAEPEVARLRVPDNRLDTWVAALREHLDAERSHCAIDVTAARTIPKLAAAQVLRPVEDHELVYLDVQDYRYEAKPFAYVPYNLQTVRSLRRERNGSSYRKVQFFGAMPGTPPMSRLDGVRRTGPSDFEVSLPWESLIVLLNEAGAAKQSKDKTAGVESFDIKLPACGVTVASYDLETRRFRLGEWDGLTRDLDKVRNGLKGAWRHEVPGSSFILESLASARLMPYADQGLFETHLHQVAAQTRGPNPGVPLKALALDTNAFYLEFFTSIAHAARVPMPRIPVVASEISLQEIRFRMEQRFPDETLPGVLKRSGVYHPAAARKAHAAHEEFQLLRHRCAMTVINQNAAGREGRSRNDANDAAILRDFDHHRRKERQELLVISDDAGFIERAKADHPHLEAVKLGYPDPEQATVREADIDQVAYFIYRLAVGFGLVHLKGMEVAVHGDHPADAWRGFLHENVRIGMKDTPWTRGFVHETTLREPLRQVVTAGGLWL